MLSVISCISDWQQYDNFCRPALLNASQYLEQQGLEPLQIITIDDASSIFEGYNRGMQQAQFSIKVFLHQDVDMLAPVWALKLAQAFANNPYCALIGLVGTQKLGAEGFWWTTGKQYLIGSVFSGEERANWVFRDIKTFTPVECIDGFFMATNRSIPFDESLQGFHLYDMDYSRTMLQRRYSIGVIPHQAWHIGAIRDQNVEDYFVPYRRKWGL